METLIATASAADPFVAGSVEGLTVPGPVMALLRSRPFGALWLQGSSDPGRAALLRDAIFSEFPALVVESVGEFELPGRLAPVTPSLGTFTVLAGDPVAAFGAAFRLQRAGHGFRMATVVDWGPAGEPVFSFREFGSGGHDPLLREPRATYGDRAFPGPEMVRFDDETAPQAMEDPVKIARNVGLVGEHPLLLAELEKVAAVASHPFPLLIIGETGAGKGLLARFVHALSDRRAKPFVSVNCAAVPEQLVESILFGHVKGAFTGATGDQAGKFALADGGTLFLDEIGEMPLALQPKLLKVLEDGIVEPVGSGKGRKVDVRVIAATNRDLRMDIAARTFREDLYYRLAFVTAQVPPLRDRRSDIHLIALHILNRFNSRLKEPRQLAVDALRRLEQSEWRGNVRDLENVVGRSVLMARQRVVRAEDLLFDQVTSPPPPSQLPEPQEGFSLETFLREARQQLIQRALDKSGGRQSAAARLLGLTPQAISHYLKRADD